MNLKAPLSGGTAAAGDLVLIGSSDGRLFALNAADGKTRWQTRLNGEVLAAPAISEKLVAVRTGDGKLHGLSPADGHELWSLEQQVPRLSLRGTARPIIIGDVVLCGFDNGKVLAVNGKDGSVQWEATVTPPHGRTELERLSDIDSTMWVQGQNVYAVSFQGRVAMLALDTGQVWWSHEMSSYRGMTLDDDNLYISTAEGEVVALNARTGAEVWPPERTAASRPDRAGEHGQQRHRARRLPGLRALARQGERDDHRPHLGQQDAREQRAGRRRGPGARGQRSRTDPRVPRQPAGEQGQEEAGGGPAAGRAAGVAPAAETPAAQAPPPDTPAPDAPPPAAAPQ